MEKLELAKAHEVDKYFLHNLRKSTMVEHLEKAGVYLSEEEHMARIHKNFEGAFIILKANKRIGLLKYVETECNIEILQFQIVPECQGLGIGKEIINKQISEAQQLNRNLILKVLKDNPARYLYERCGFTIVGEDQYEYCMQLNSKLFLLI